MASGEGRIIFFTCVAPDRSTTLERLAPYPEVCEQKIGVDGLFTENGHEVGRRVGGGLGRVRGKDGVNMI